MPAKFFRGRTYHRRKVICLETGELFSSYSELAAILGKSESWVVSCIATSHQLCGKHFAYENEYETIRQYFETQCR